MSGAIQKNLNYKRFVLDANLRYFKPHSTKIEKTFAEEIRSSLSRSPKSIAPKFFYDLRGSELFERICGLPEYYLARTEISILKRIQDELYSYIDKDYKLVELGSGSSTKTRLILDVFDRLKNPIEYFPIDISEILAESSERLLSDYPRLHITGIIDTYERGLDFVKKFDEKKSLIVFLGSSYGNFVPPDGRTFLASICGAMKPGDLLLLGLDMVKDAGTLESAYNDSLGVTAKFNLNVLSRINDELDADFDLDNFEHRAIYNKEMQRIEMYLESLVNQKIVISRSNMLLSLKPGELIGTEHSYKFTPEQIRRMLHDAGFHIKRAWQDDDSYFTLVLASKP